MNLAELVGDNFEDVSNRWILPIIDQHARTTCCCVLLKNENLSRRMMMCLTDPGFALWFN